MSLYRRSLLGLVLAALVGAGTVACDTSKDEETESSEEEESTTEEQSYRELSDEELEELPFYADGPVATVDGEEVSSAQFNDMIHEQIEYLPVEVQPQMVERFRDDAVNASVDQFLIDKTLREAGTEVSDEEIEEVYQRFMDGMGGDEEAFESQLEMMGMTKDDFREQMAKHARLEKYLADKHDLSVPEEEVQQMFEMSKGQFGGGDEVHARHILIKTEEDADEATIEEAEQRAQEVYEQASAEGADFEELAKELSEGPSASRGGDLGFFGRGDMVPTFSEAAFSMEPGDISEPVRSPFGFHVIQVVDTREGEEVELEDVREKLEFQLEEQKLRQTIQQFIEELREEADVEMHTDNIVMNMEPSDAPAGMPGMPPGGGGGAAPGGAAPGGAAPGGGGGGAPPQLELEEPSGGGGGAQPQQQQELELEIGE